MRKLTEARPAPRRPLRPVMTRGLRIPVLSLFKLLADALAALSVGILRPLPPLRRFCAGLLMRRRALGAMAALLVAVLAAWSLWPPGPVQAQGSDPTLILAAYDMPVEGGGGANLVVALDKPAGPDGVTVNFTVSGGTATLGTDYTMKLTSVEIAPGASAGANVIYPIDDAAYEGDETIILVADVPVLSLSSNTLTLTIRDNDRPSSDATLSGLELLRDGSGIALRPAFDSQTVEYGATVPLGNAWAVLRPTASHSGATITVAGNAVKSGSNSERFFLHINTPLRIEVAVTAEDGVTRRVYALTATHSPVAELADLTVSKVKLHPLFSGLRADYRGWAPYSVERVTVTPTNRHDKGTITVNGQEVASGESSPEIALTEGENVITVTITSPDRYTSMTYTIAVVRASASASGDATLRGLSVHMATSNQPDAANEVPYASEGYSLSPELAAGVYEYRVRLPEEPTGNDLTHLYVTTVATTAAPGAKSIMVSGKRSDEEAREPKREVVSGESSGPWQTFLGYGLISVEVTSLDGMSTLTYRVILERGSVDDPRGVKVTPGDGQLTLSWGENTGAGAPELYWARWREAGTERWLNDATLSGWKTGYGDGAPDGTSADGQRMPSAGSTYVISGLSNGTEYEVELRGTRGGDTSYGVTNWLKSEWVEVRGTPGRGLTITPSAPRREYGGVDDLGYTVGGLVDGDAAGDVVAGVLSRAAGDDAGSYAFDMSGLSVAAAYAGKYVLPSAPVVSAYTITPRAITAISGVRVNGRPVDGTTDATFDTSAAEGAGVLASELGDFRAGGLVVSGVFPAATAGTHSLSVTYSLQDHASFKATNYTLSTTTDTLQGEISDVAVTVETPTETGKELLMPPCEPDPDRRPDPKPGVITFIMCEDHLTIESVSTASDITFYPEFTPDRHHYVVHVADSITGKLRVAGAFQAGVPISIDPYAFPGFAWAFADGQTVDERSTCGRRDSPAIQNNQRAPYSPSDVCARLVNLSPGVTTIQIGGSHWFKRLGASASELEANDRAYFGDSDKIARKTYTLQLVWKSPSTALEAPVEPPAPRTVDYDTDDDGLIEISNLTQLDAMRWDVNGDGYSDHGGPLHEGFLNALLGMGCPQSGCIGYELTTDLDFDTNGNGRADAGDAYWNSGHGWLPIGIDTYDYNAVFEGNGHIVRNLYIDSTPQKQSIATEYALGHSYAIDAPVGLFQEVGPHGFIRNLGLESAQVSRCPSQEGCARVNVGGLAGVNRGEISNSYVTGAVSNRGSVLGGLVGTNHGSIRGSHATARVTGTASSNPAQAHTGGLVGKNEGIISESYATGAVTGKGYNFGGLVGLNTDRGAVIASFATGVVESDGYYIGGLVGRNAGTVTAVYAIGSVNGSGPALLAGTGTQGALIGRNGNLVDVAYALGRPDGVLVGPVPDSSSRIIAGYSYRATAAGNPEFGGSVSLDQLRQPTGYTGIYADWNVDLDGDASTDDPWDFGTSSQFPALKISSITPAGQRALTPDISPADRQSVNREPRVFAALSDVTIVQGSGTKTVSLFGAFSDPDGDALTITATSSDETVATVAVSSDGSTLTLEGVSEGTATVTVTAQDTEGNRASDAFDVSVSGEHAALIAQMYEWRNDPCCVSDKIHTDRWDRALLAFGETVADTTLTPMTAAEAQALVDRGWERWVEVAAALREIESGGRQQQQGTPNSAPTVSSAIADATIVSESGTQQVSLSGVFSDADSDSLTITAASSDEAVVTVSVASGYSSLTVSAQSWGTATVTVTADDGNGGTVSDTFTVTVKAAPVVVTDLSSVTGLEVGKTGEVSVSDVFSDADGDALTITAASSDEAVATVAVSSDGSTLTLTGVGEGTATITVTAQDADGNTVNDTFEAPVAKKFASLIAQMKEWRGDPCCVSDKAHTDRWDRALLAFGETVADTTLTPMTADEAQALVDRGWTRWAEVTAALREIESGGQQQQQGTPNSAPTVSAAIGDATIIHESGVLTVSLSGVFSDADYDNLTISASSSDETKATVSAAGYLKLRVTAKSRGTAAITVTADDGNGGTVSDTFTVRVKAAPVVASAIGDVTGLEAGATREVSLSGVFSDADTDTLTVSAASSADAIATVTVAADRSKLTVAGVAGGTANITVTAQDSDGNAVSDAFDVSVAAPQQDPPPQDEDSPTGAPTVAKPLADVSLEGPPGWRAISLSGVFHDPDGDDLILTVVSSDHGVASMYESVFVDGSTLTVLAMGTGTATITVTAEDPDGNRVSDSFEVTVTPPAS